MRRAGTKQFRVFYFAGPGNVAESLGYWSKGIDHPAITSVTYSGQLFDVCRELGIRVHAVSSGAFAKADFVQSSLISAEHRPRKYKSKSGWRFYFEEIKQTIKISFLIIKHRADVAVISEHGIQWWVLGPLRMLGVKIIPALHCAFWPCGCRPQGVKHRILRWLNGWFWRHCAYATICVSPECAKQVEELAKAKCSRVSVGLAHYRRGYLDVVAPSDYQSKPFRIMFAGRLEREKGVFDLIEIAQLLQQDMPDGFEIEICGIGPAKESLINEIQSRGLTSRIKMSGQLDREQMKEAYGRSHVVIVPTKTGSFVEGLNKVVVESVLAGRPAVTSRLSNALEVVNNAAIEVPPDDVKAYAAALKQLASDHELYERARSGCYEAAQHFYDPHKSWGTILRTIILPLLKPFATYKSDCDAQRKNNSPLQDQIS